MNNRTFNSVILGVSILIMSLIASFAGTPAIFTQTNALNGIEGMYSRLWLQPDTTKKEIAPLTAIIGQDGQVIGNNGAFSLPTLITLHLLEL